MHVLENQVALIVGAAGGVGSGVVRRYLEEGAKVVAADRNPDRLAVLENEVGDSDNLITCTADAATWSGSEQMVRLAIETFGGLDVLVSCVGLYDFGAKLIDIEPSRLEAAAQECFHVNVYSLLLNIRAALPELARRRGRIVVTASYSAFRPSGGGVLYVAAKHAVVGLVTQLGYELAPTIRINGVAPGVAKTVMSGLSALGQEPRDALQPGVEDVLPLGILPSNDDYGGIYALLGSASDSAAMTGTVVVADSGLLVRGLTSPNGGGVAE
ncbi:SDR family NAD(P)-dependent oxidoreductase [Mycobacterium sp.]|uniref:SDR family NAD(P)-dependent oxidoreductase n=1 Tax=Mycobacterium sp. TaxID=1785 RepID=UPI002C51E0EA|nr:SDR family NAD(P)-dependent oxidoreductase [Mycobacterium sp.]HKP42733.1 SDR family NAD(P)-dependent oxidoreductase [Mycobacterium sp.]